VSVYLLHVRGYLVILWQLVTKFVMFYVWIFQRWSSVHKIIGGHLVIDAVRMKYPVSQLCIEKLNGGAPEHRTARTWRVAVSVIINCQLSSFLVTLSWQFISNGLHALVKFLHLNGLFFCCTSVKYALWKKM